MSVSVSVSEPEEASSSQESARVVGFLALEVGLMVRLLRVLERSFGSTVMAAIEVE